MFLIKNSQAKKPVKSVLTRDSAATPSIQLCDLLLGAVMETWQQDNTNSTREAVRDCIASYLGWPALDSDTFKEERKFNIWYYLDRTREKRNCKKLVKLTLYIHTLTEMSANKSFNRDAPKRRAR